MNVTQLFQFFLNSAVDIDRLSQTLPLAFQLQHSIAEMSEARVLDTFDHPLRLSGRLLVQHQGNLLLFNPNKATVLMQSCLVPWQFVSDLVVGVVKDELSDIAPLRAFLPICSINMQIGRVMLLDDEKKTHVRAHFYTFEREKRIKTFGTTQPLQGYKKGHRLLVNAFVEQGAQVRQESADLYLFLGADTQIYSSKPRLTLPPEAPASETTRRIITTYLQVARQNEAGIQADYDTEFLHDYRVSLRKVRSVLSLFKGVYSESDTIRLKHAFSDIMKQTNRLRDLDVYLLDKGLYFSMVPESMHEGLRMMFEVFVKERRQQLKHVMEMLSSDTYNEAIGVLVEQFSTADILEKGPKGDEPTLPFACQLIWKRYNKVRKIARRINSETPDEEVHTLRIQCKKLRYLMEFFAPLFPGESIKKLIKSLKQLQDNLGRFNDFSVQQVSLQEFLREHAQDQYSLKLAESIGALITVLHQRQGIERRQIMENFIRFDSPEIRHVFRTLFTQEYSS